MKTNFKSLFQTLKDLKDDGFTTLLSLVCIDLSTGENKNFMLTYTLFNPTNRQITSVETTTNSTIDSVSTLFKSANYDEREIYDLFGLKFEGHPNLKRLLMPDDFEGHPMLNAYKQDDKRLLWNK